MQAVLKTLNRLYFQNIKIQPSPISKAQFPQTKMATQLSQSNLEVCACCISRLNTPATRVKAQVPQAHNVLRNRNILRVCMGNLAIIIQGIKIETKTHQNFIPYLLVLLIKKIKKRQCIGPITPKKKRYRLLLSVQNSKSQPITPALSSTLSKRMDLISEN